MKKILLVDDTVTSRRIIKTFLKDLPVEIIEATDGHHALELINKKIHFDLIFTDIQMPNMDGLSMTKKIRSWEKINGKSRVTIISFSACRSSEEVKYCYEAGCDDHLSKPINKNDLLDNVFRHLSFDE